MQNCVVRSEGLGKNEGKHQKGKPRHGDEIPILPEAFEMLAHERLYQLRFYAFKRRGNSSSIKDAITVATVILHPHANHSLSYVMSIR